jgi:polyvinyl alcohol dehydrogenase (cytochrome)
VISLLGLSFTMESVASECDNTNKTPGLIHFYSNGWGIDHANTRFQPKSSINADNVSRLRLKWVYGFSTNQPRSYPLVTEDTIFIADGQNGLVALDRETGCTRWLSPQKGPLGSAVIHRRDGDDVSLFFTDRMKEVIAVNATDGKRLWAQSPGDNPVPMYSGSPLVHGDTIFVPLSSMEIALVANPFYGCCTTSGGMAALDSKTGEVRWHIRSVPEMPHVTGRHFLFVEEHGPSGAPVWGAPTLDANRGLLYFGTGQNYSRPASSTSDAIFAVNVKDGTTHWVRQFTQGDAWNIACTISTDHVNCPKPVGPDLDFGAPPILTSMPDGSAVLIAGQKSGDVHAMKPETGELLWQKMRVGRGGALGGIHWGMAVNPLLGLVLVPISDVYAGDLTGEGKAQPGLFALDIATGERLWAHERQRRAESKVSAGLSAAITATSDLVFTSSLDGFIEVIEASTGKLLWSHDTWRDYKAINNLPTAGGAFDAHGPMVADDLLIISSGYGSFGQKGGNALLVFQLEEESP